MSLQEHSEEELLEELKRRKVKRPKPLAQADFSALRKLCSDYLDQLGTDEEDDDMEHYIFETALEGFYGKDVWDFVNGVRS